MQGIPRWKVVGFSCGNFQWFNKILAREFPRLHIRYTVYLHPFVSVLRWKMIMALKRLLQLACFSFFVTGEIEENCNMQLQVAKPENVTQQKNGNSPLPGYHRLKNSQCGWPLKNFRPFDGLEDCAYFCGGCTFAVDLDIPGCQCCKYPLRILRDQADYNTLYIKKRTDDPCRGEVATTETSWMLQKGRDLWLFWDQKTSKPRHAILVRLWTFQGQQRFLMSCKFLW